MSDISMDENFIVLRVSEDTDSLDATPDPTPVQYEIRRTWTFELVNTIRFERSFSRFSYYDGLIVTYSDKDSIR